MRYFKFVVASIALTLTIQGGYSPRIDQKENEPWFYTHKTKNDGLLSNVTAIDINNEDVSQAVIWYKKRAIKGNAGAQNNLGLIYANGIEVLQDYKRAVKWYRKGAEQGYSLAQNNLATMYLEGKGVSQNYKLAKKWFHKAAKQGNLDAQRSLMFIFGEKI